MLKQYMDAYIHTLWNMRIWLLKKRIKKTWDEMSTKNMLRVKQELNDDKHYRSTFVIMMLLRIHNLTIEHQFMIFHIIVFI